MTTQKNTTATFIAGFLVLIIAAVTPAYCGDSQYNIAVLPIKQDNLPNTSRLTQAQLMTDIATCMSQTPICRLRSFDEVTSSIDDKLIDDAVFELIITNELTDTMRRLDDLATASGQLTSYCTTASELGIDYLVELTCQPHRRNLQITCRIIDTQTTHCLSTKTFTDVPNDPVGTSAETARRLIRQLWQQKNRDK